jgi:broad specificity phosphatase PhoE
MSVEIVFETHSWSTDNEAGLATGWLDGRLSEKGRQLAAELGRRRRDDSIAAVFTSDLGRAVETAHIAFGETEIPIREDARLRECNYGALNGMPAARLEPERRIEEPYPDGESYRQVVARVRAFLDELGRTHDGERVVVIGHAATRWALDHLLAGAPLEDLVAAPFGWREGWLYVLPDGWGTPAR